MKHKTITTDKATLLVIEMPERIVEISNTGKRIAIPDRKGGHHFIYGNWQLLGRLPDITENEWKGVVDDYDNGYFYYPDGYKDTCDTATESGLSLLQANEVCFENRELKWKTFDTEEKYKQAQSKVWDKELTYLFIKVD